MHEINRHPRLPASCLSALLMTLTEGIFTPALLVMASRKWPSLPRFWRHLQKPSPLLQP